MIIPIVPIALKTAIRRYDLDGDTMLTTVKMIITTTEKAAKNRGVVSVPANEERPELPVTTAMVEMDGPNDNVNIQFNEIAMNGKPVKRKP